MKPLTGYRTLAFGFAVTLLGLLGKHVSPELINQYLDVIFAAIGTGIVVLRLMTSSPVFAAIERQVGMSDAQVADLQNYFEHLVVSNNIDMTNQVQALNESVTKLSAHPLFQTNTEGAASSQAPQTEGAAAGSEAAAVSPQPQTGAPANA